MDLSRHQVLVNRSGRVDQLRPVLEPIQLRQLRAPGAHTHTGGVHSGDGGGCAGRQLERKMTMAYTRGSSQLENHGSHEVASLAVMWRAVWRGGNGS